MKERNMFKQRVVTTYEVKRQNQTRKFVLVFRYVKIQLTVMFKEVSWESGNKSVHEVVEAIASGTL